MTATPTPKTGRTHAPRSRSSSARTIAAWALSFACSFIPLPAEAEVIAGLELVLAVDVSGSMSKAELLVQRQGYISALRSPDIANAINRNGAVALAYIEWGGPREQRIIVPWMLLSDDTDAARFAEKLAEAPLDPGFRSAPWETGTSISAALRFASSMFSGDGFARQTIDISGDGPNNSGGPLATAREYVLARGITINGLPMVNPAARFNFLLDVYYEDCVIGGLGAFSIEVDDPSLFERSIRRKLVLEIAGREAPILAAAFGQTGAPRTDCEDILDGE